MPDFTTIITSAAVATVISGGVTLLANWRQRSHEARMQKLADARALRDRKIERVWTGLNVVCEVALDLHDASSRLWLHQGKALDEVDRIQIETDRKLAPVRASLVLDADTESLLRQVVDCSNDYRKFAVALRLFIETRERHGDIESSRPVVMEAWQKVRTEAYSVLNGARRTLAEIEKPIGGVADIRAVPTVGYFTSPDADTVEKARASFDG
jgi:hypothetical protein